MPSLWHSPAFSFKYAPALSLYPRKIIYFPQTGKVRMKKIQDLHNDTIAQREKQYLSVLKNAPVEGEVELF